MLTDLRVLIVRMMQAPRDDRIDSFFRICLPWPTYLLLTVAVRAGDALQVTMQLLLTMPILPYPCFYAYTSPILTMPMLTRYLALPRLFLHPKLCYYLRGATRLEDDQAHAIDQLRRVAA